MKRLLVSFGAVLVLLVFAGCSTNPAIVEKMSYSAQFSASDFEIGNIVTAEMTYEDDNPHMKDIVLNKAIGDAGCDTILLPRYEVEKKLIGKDLIKVIGRCATFKKR